MIRKHLVVAVATAGFAVMLGCSASVKPPVVAVAVPEPVAVVEAPPPPPAPPPPRLATVCDAEIRAGGHLHFPHEVEFDIGKSSLKSTPTTNAILQCLVDFLANNKMVTKFRLEGYTDNAGDPAANLTLSQQRADAVIAWMVGHGADGAKLWAKGFGVARPVSPNDSPEHMAQNRRVEFHIDELSGVKATKDSIALAMNPPAPVVVAGAPAVVGVMVPGVAVGVPTVAVGVPAVGVAVPHVGFGAPGVAVVGVKGAVAAPGVAVGVAVPTGVSVGVGVGGGAPGKGAPAKADPKDKDKKK
jgi:outer membrane protein OmpA-like peptidoglycan-associated protein